MGTLWGPGQVPKKRKIGEWGGEYAKSLNDVHKYGADSNCLCGWTHQRDPTLLLTDSNWVVLKTDGHGQLE